MKRSVAPAYLLLTPFFIFISVCCARAAASPFYRLNNADEGETEVEKEVSTPPEDEVDTESAVDIELKPGMDTTIFDGTADTEGPPQADKSDSGGGAAKTESVDSPGKEIKSETDSGPAGNTPADTEKIISPDEEKSAPPEESKDKETKAENKPEQEESSDNSSTTEKEETKEEKNSSRAEEEKNSRADVPPLPGPLLVEHLTAPEYISTTASTEASVMVSDFDTGSQKLLTAGELTGPPAGGFYIPWIYLGGGGLLVLFVFIVWWKRRPRKVNIYHDETSTKAEDYFKNHFNRHTALTNGGSDWREKYSSKSSSNSFRRKARPIWKYEDEKLRKLGIDPKYREALRLYYSRGLPLERIARETGLGKGEIGLVIDLTNRLREEAV